METLISLGGSRFDVALLIFAPICGFLGATVRAYILEGSLEKYSEKGKTFLDTITYRDFQWFFYHSFIGAVTGLLVALLFIGGLKEELSSLGRVLAVAMIAGYSSLNLWKRQERAVERILEEKLGKISDSGDHSGPHA